MKYVALVLMTILLSGCSIGRDIRKIGCEEMTLNAQSIRELAVCILENWLTHSGLIRGALGVKIDELPVEVVKSMDDLDEQALKYIEDPSVFTDKELGGVVGKKLRLCWAVVAKALETYAPDVLQYITILI